MATVAAALAVFGCATRHEQYGKNSVLLKGKDSTSTAEVTAHRFYLIGDAGYADSPHSQRLLALVGNKLKTEGKKTTLLYLGDNIYPLGMPKEGKKGRAEAEASLNSQIALAGLFSGKTYFIPGNHDWYHGLDGDRKSVV